MANERTDTKGKTVKVTLIRSTTGFKDNQEVVARGLGLRKLNSSVELKDTPAIRGMIHKIRHLVEVK
jgi:large subunit ribosomal protein L30